MKQTSNLGGPVALIIIALWLVGIFAASWLGQNPEPARHYDAERGVMCYTVPGGDLVCGGRAMKSLLWPAPLWVHRLILRLTGYRLRARMVDTPKGRRAELSWVRQK